jgi:exopolyphosphatase/guanosine-5'-triphosphate,3'-diphosphate pyrophosphatase
MAAILRVAGGLDRSRTQQVRDVVATVDDGRVFLDVVADQDPQVDIWGAERRTELFEKVFGLKLAVRWAGAPAVG